jgi:hypothetical protein
VPNDQWICQSLDEETITMTTAEQRRAWVLTKVIAGEVEATEAALVRVEVAGFIRWAVKCRRHDASRPISSDEAVSSGALGLGLPLAQSSPGCPES